MTTEPKPKPRSVEDLLLVFVASLQETGHTMDEIRAGLRAIVPSDTATRAAILEEAAKVADALAVNRERVSFVAAHACRAIAERIRALSPAQPDRIQEDTNG